MESIDKGRIKIRKEKDSFLIYESKTGGTYKINSKILEFIKKYFSGKKQVILKESKNNPKIKKLIEDLHAKKIL